MKGRQKGSDRVGRHVTKAANFVEAKVPLELDEIAPVGLDGVTRETAFDADMIEIARNESVGVHFADDSQSFRGRQRGAQCTEP